MNPDPEATPIDYFICGGFGGICSTFAGYPLDTIKVRLQTMPKPEFGQQPYYKGMLDCFKKTILQEGIYGLYKGMLLPLLTVTPIFAVSFMSYRIGKQIFGKNDPEMTYAQKFTAGAFSGFVTSFIMCPVEHIKCTLQVRKETGAKPMGPYQLLKSEYQYGGIARIFKGFNATVLREIPYSGVYFISFEIFTNCKNLDTKTAIIYVAGGIILPAVVLFAIGLPFDVLKSRYQTAPRGRFPGGISQVFRELINNEGYRGLYKGATPLLVRIIPAYTACFYGFHFCQDSIVKPIKEIIKNREEYCQNILL